MAVGNTDPDRRAMDDAIAAPDSSPARPIVRKKRARRGGREGEVGGGRERTDAKGTTGSGQGYQKCSRDVERRKQGQGKKEGQSEWSGDNTSVSKPRLPLLGSVGR